MNLIALLALIFSIVAVCFVGVSTILFFYMYSKLSGLLKFKEKAEGFLTQVGNNSMQNTNTMINNFKIISKRLQQIDAVLRDEDTPLDETIKQTFAKKDKKDLN